MVFDRDPRLVLALVEGLVNLHGELSVALAGEAFRGWDPLRATVADLFDLLAHTVEWKGETPSYPRPVQVKPKQGRRPFEIFGGIG